MTILKVDLFFLFFFFIKSMAIGQTKNVEIWAIQKEFDSLKLEVQKLNTELKSYKSTRSIIPPDTIQSQEYWEALYVEKGELVFEPDTFGFKYFFSKKAKKLDGQVIQLRGYFQHPYLYLDGIVTPIIFTQHPYQTTGGCTDIVDNEPIVEVSEKEDGLRIYMLSRIRSGRAIVLEGTIRLNTDIASKYAYTLKNVVCLDCPSSRIQPLKKELKILKLEIKKLNRNLKTCKNIALKKSKKLIRKRKKCTYPKDTISGTLTIINVLKIKGKINKRIGYQEYEVKVTFRPHNYHDLNRNDKAIWENEFLFKIDPMGKNLNVNASYIRKYRVFKGTKFNAQALPLESGTCNKMIFFSNNLPTSKEALNLGLR